MHIIEVPVGEFQPLYVAARYIDKVIIGIARQTWANWRYLKIGPRYYKVNGAVYYKISELEEYFGRHPVQTFDINK